MNEILETCHVSSKVIAIQYSTYMHDNLLFPIWPQSHDAYLIWIFFILIILVTVIPASTRFLPKQSLKQEKHIFILQLQINCIKINLYCKVVLLQPRTVFSKWRTLFKRKTKTEALLYMYMHVIYASNVQMYNIYM